MSQLEKKQLIAGIVTLLVIAGVAGGSVLTSDKKDSVDSSADTQTMNTGSAKSTVAADTAPASSSAFKDGSYTATGTYFSPGGTQHIAVSVTLKDSIITDSTATSKASDHESQEYQDDFISHFKTLVVGKKIDSVSLSRVSGSSLTSQGFNEAIDKIEAEAKI